MAEFLGFSEPPSLQKKARLCRFGLQTPACSDTSGSFDQHKQSRRWMSIMTDKPPRGDQQTHKDHCNRTYAHRHSGAWQQTKAAIASNKLIAVFWEKKMTKHSGHSNRTTLFANSKEKENLKTESYECNCNHLQIPPESLDPVVPCVLRFLGPRSWYHVALYHVGHKEFLRWLCCQ